MLMPVASLTIEIEIPHAQSIKDRVRLSALSKNASAILQHLDRRA